MEGKNVSYETIDEYITQFPPDVQDRLKRLRNVIKAAAPEAEEKISYRMPTFTLHGNLVHFAAFKKHIGFYPTPHGIYTFKDELAQYERGKGSVQFPLDKPLPYELVRKIVKARVAENKKLAESKAKNKK